MKFDKLKKIFLVAEIGNNHEGSFKLAKKLILSAKKCGADAFLIGSSIMKSDNIVEQVRKLVNSY